jgi:hypothetical protein
MGTSGSRPRSKKTEFVDVDTLVLSDRVRRFRFRFTPRKGCAVTLVAVTHWLAKTQIVYRRQRSAAWGKILSVPERSQFEIESPPGRLCSPTSLAMVLEFHGVKISTPKVAAGVYDHAAKLYGNWPFNTAFAHRASAVVRASRPLRFPSPPRAVAPASVPTGLRGDGATLSSFVQHARSLADLEAEILAGRPAIASIRWQPGQLDGAPLPRSSGHLLVVKGFTQSGDVVVNDPAVSPGQIERVYKRRQFHDAWLKRGSGIFYVIADCRLRIADR